ncbi:MAG: OmpH family outer membrane protein [Gammaproteobacteria bacterium]|nr:OmpH family outer membrane protein [Gammaproteobacteria bacterium]
MKLKLVTFIVVGLFSLAVNAEIKSAFINPALVMENSPQAKNAAVTLRDEFEDREKKLRIGIKELQALEKSYQTDSAIMSDDQRKKNEEEIIQKKRKFQFEQQLLKEDLQARSQELVKAMQIEISTVIRSYGSTHSYDFIFTEGVVYASEAVDITDKILKELENNTLPASKKAD